MPGNMEERKQFYKQLQAQSKELYERFKARKEELRLLYRQQGRKDTSDEEAYVQAKVELARGDLAAPVLPAGPPPEQLEAQAAKERLHRDAGPSMDLEAFVRWAAKWAPVVGGGPFIKWQVISEQAPGPAALGFLEQAVANPASFYNQVVTKVLGKQQESEKEWLPAARKQEAELKRYLEEIQAEVAEKGINAYAS